MIVNISSGKCSSLLGPVAFVLDIAMVSVVDGRAKSGGQYTPVFIYVVLQLCLAFRERYEFHGNLLAISAPRPTFCTRLGPTIVRDIKLIEELLLHLKPNTKQQLDDVWVKCSA